MANMPSVLFSSRHNCPFWWFFVVLTWLFIDWLHPDSPANSPGGGGAANKMEGKRKVFTIRRVFWVTYFSVPRITVSETLLNFAKTPFEELPQYHPSSSEPKTLFFLRTRKIQNGKMQFQNAIRDSSVLRGVTSIAFLRFAVTVSVLRKRVAILLASPLTAHY